MLLNCSHLEESTAPTFTGSHPVPIDEVKSFLKITVNDNDSEIKRMIETVTRREQEQLGIQIPQATYKLYVDDFQDRIEIPRPPVSSVSSITYLDTDGDEQTLATTVYRVTQLNQRRRPAVVTLAYNQTWPSTRNIERNVWITFVCGWSTSNVPADVRALIMHGVEAEFYGIDNEKAMDRIRGNLKWTTAI